MRFLVPSSIVDEVLDVCARRGVSAMPGNAEVSFPNHEAAEVPADADVDRLSAQP